MNQTTRSSTAPQRGVVVLGVLAAAMALLVTYILTPSPGQKIYPKYIIQAGLVLLFAGGLDAADLDRVDQTIAAAPADVQDKIRTIYHDATLDGFPGAIVAEGVVALFGAVLAFWLPKQKLEGEGVEEALRQAVRNPTIPAMQLEMDDPAPSKWV